MPMNRPFDRRTFLKGSGVLLALPLLETMRSAEAGIGIAPRRMVNICNTLGLYTQSWLPE